MYRVYGMGYHYSTHSDEIHMTHMYTTHMSQHMCKGQLTWFALKPGVISAAEIIKRNEGQAFSQLFHQLGVMNTNKTKISLESNAVSGRIDAPYYSEYLQK